ncbi:acyl-CoA carboxylase epsilon subunit [Streptomyces sp. Amel2xC10]|uniref:acyl-CoA carboxylase epsilon subunit n=1 Tax=Streptomyces sp. Amel2xC10 TaxID=1305826 RepID=UPI000A08EA47|nr:acyl-CoA carboxylase epsilon subunit [Streptomyces sp. Amel2xC10]SMF56933.1 Acyl-CoA carboxylase epsilon subunit [Streptomyces sp. Amel2xC10]
MSAARGPGADAVVRVVRGAPGPDELAAVVAVLTALTAARVGRAAPQGPPRAVWPDADRPFTRAASAWTAAPGPRWRESSHG